MASHDSRPKRYNTHWQKKYFVKRITQYRMTDVLLWFYSL